MSAPRSTESSSTKILRFLIRLSPYALAAWSVAYGHVLDDSPIAEWTFLGAILLWILLLMLRIGGRAYALDTVGVAAPATLISATGAGRIDEEPAMRVRVRVTPTDGSTPYEVAKRMPVDAVQRQRLRPGTPIQIRSLPKRPRIWRIDWEAVDVVA